MADRLFCDRCREPVMGKSYELFLMPHHSTSDDYYRGDLCEHCYRAIARVVPLPLKPVEHWHDRLNPALLDNLTGDLWKRLWRR